MANKYLDKQGLQRVKRDLDIQLADYGKSLSVSIDTTTYVITFQLKNGNTVISEQSVDLPLESVVVGGSYDDDTETIILTLKNGQTIEIPVSDLVSGLVSQNDLQTTLASYYTSGETDTLLSGKQDTIDSTHKLSADLVNDSDTTNKFVSASEKTTWNEKQDELTTSDLDTESLAYYVGFDSNGKLSKGSPQTITIATEVQENNNNAVSSDAVYNYAYPLTNPNGFISGINSTMVTNALGYTPYNSSNPSGYQANVLESISLGGVAQTITNKNADLPAYPTKTSLGLDNVVNVGLDNVPTQYSDNGVKSGGVYDAIQDVSEKASGKTKNYVISYSALTGYVNNDFNSTQTTITISISGNKIKDIENKDVDLSDLQVGDDVYIIEENVPDRWVGSISGGNIVFYKLETKIDVASSVQSGNANPVSSGAVYSELTTNYLPLSGTSSLAGSIVPTTNNTYNLGSSSYSFYEGYIKDIYASSYQIEGYTFATMGGSAFDVGNGNKELDLWGSGTRPTYNEKDIMVIDDELKSRYHLGAYDTVDTSNADYDLITRKTGYIDRNNILEYASSGTLPYQNFFIITKDNIPYNKVKNNLGCVAYENGAWGSNYYLSFAYTSVIQNQQELNDIINKLDIQYELATSYTEKVIKNQPLNTLEQKGSQWVRNEWEKTLNLFNALAVKNGTENGGSPVSSYTLSVGTVNITNRGASSSNCVSLAVNTEIGKTYSFKSNVSATTSLSFISNGGTIIYDGSYTDNELKTFVATTTITYIFLYARTTTSCLWSNIMLNEGDNAYPYQPYSGEIVHKLDLLNVIYPVGSIYMSVNNVSPETFLGGTWEQIQGKFLLGATNGTVQQDLADLGYARSSSGYHYWTDSNGTRHSITPNTDNYSETGGEVKHTLSLSEMPAHDHRVIKNDESVTSYVVAGGSAVQSGSDYPFFSWTSTIDRNNILTNVVGGGQAHNNMPPYLVVYMWKRTA